MKKRVFGILSAVFFLIALGMVGNIEQDRIALLPGMAIAFASEALFGLFAWLGGYFYDPNDDDGGGGEEW